MSKPHIAIFASGRGSNAVKIHNHGIRSSDFDVSLIVTNRKNAGVLEYAEKNGIKQALVTRQSFYDTDEILDELEKQSVDLIVLAGFLWLIPTYLIKAFPQKIVNIHPAILPKYGGKGMYGQHVHEAVKTANETQSGITIHWVNEKYDEGKFILQSKCGIENLQANEIAQRVLKMEHHFYPRVISGLVKNS